MQVLEGPSCTLKALKLRDGAKLMLMSGASGVATGGQVAARAQVKQRAEAAKARLAAGLPGARAPGNAATPRAPTLADRAAGWAKTGVVSLRGEGRRALPAEAWAGGAAIRVADLSDNALIAVPHEGLAALRSLQRLRLAGNGLPSEGLGALGWAAISCMKQLVQLDLSRNRLSDLPAEIGRCHALQVLAVSHNQLPSLPAELCELLQLRELDASHNQLEALPVGMCRLSALQSLSLGANRLCALPEELAGLQALASLSVPSNRLATLPPGMLAGCAALRSLDVHDNPVTVQQLRELPGWDAFDARRRAACDKAMGAKVMGGTKGFDEGADEQQWRRWG